MRAGRDPGTTGGTCATTRHSATLRASSGARSARRLRTYTASAAMSSSRSGGASSSQRATLITVRSPSGSSRISERVVGEAQRATPETSTPARSSSATQGVAVGIATD